MQVFSRDSKPLYDEIIEWKEGSSVENIALLLNRLQKEATFDVKMELWKVLVCHYPVIQAASREVSMNDIVKDSMSHFQSELFDVPLLSCVVHFV